MKQKKEDVYIMGKDINKLNINKEKKFKLSLFKLFWVFYIGCFFGVIIETIWCFIRYNKIESRTALILMPLNPIYGFGALLMTICFLKLNKSKNYIVFLGCMVLGGAFEYLCSLFQEMVFGTVSWSYSKDLLGIFKRTSAIYCVFWGILGILWIRVIYPYLSKCICKIYNKKCIILTYFLTILLITDTIFTSLALIRQMQRRNNIPAIDELQIFYDINYNDETLKKIYPNMRPVK